VVGAPPGGGWVNGPGGRRHQRVVARWGDLRHFALGRTNRLLNSLPNPTTFVNPFHRFGPKPGDWLGGRLVHQGRTAD